jgi:hypothetical protein
MQTLLAKLETASFLLQAMVFFCVGMFGYVALTYLAGDLHLVLVVRR